MKSMTGYGISEFQNEVIRVVTEIKSYNNKYLDLSLNLPPFLGPLDQQLRKLLKNRVRRGRVELTFRIKELEEDLEVVVDKGAVKAYTTALASIAKAAGINESPHISHFLKLEGVMNTIKNRDIDQYKKILFAELETVLTEYDNGRKVEGEETLKDILSNMQILQSSLDIIKLHEGKLEDVLQNNIRIRFKEMIHEELDENRLLSETALLLMKYGIAEEISRLEGHFKQFHRITAEDGPVGKKLDFLCQEINREINTIGSKNVLIEISRAVVDAKDSLEKIREQLRNVE